MTCLHPDTFDLGGTQRCSECHADAITHPDGRLLWPAQDGPLSWDSGRIASWFVDNNIYGMPQGCEGFTFQRDNRHVPTPTYGYLWQEVYLDLDYNAAWMLDIRRCMGSDAPFCEVRQFLFVAVGPFGGPVVHAWHPVERPFLDARGDRLIDGLHWFAEQVKDWQEEQQP